MKNTKVKIHKVPTSKLVYYRVYGDESPFTRKMINEELDSRSFISFNPAVDPSSIWENYNNIRTGLKTLRPKFINVFEEENKIRKRGRGLEKYAFDQDRNVYSIMRTIMNAETIHGSVDKPTVSYTAGSILTWSELVLFYNVAKKMIKVTKGHLASIQKLKASVQVNGSHSKDELHSYSDIKALESWIKSFQAFFLEVIKRVKEDLCQINMIKVPMNQADSVDIPIRYNSITSRIVPSDFYETIWDRLILDFSMMEEKRLVLSDSNSELNASIQALKEKKDNFESNYKKLTLDPTIKPTH